MMSIYDYMNHFWFENENDPCSLSEGVLYFYLLYEANRQHWASPFKVSTQMLVARLNTSKQNVMKAREGLKKRGLIDYSKGEGKGKPALYTLNLSDEQPLQLPQPLTQPLTGSLACKLPQLLPHSNIKEENNKEEVKEDNSSSPNSNIVLTLSELRAKLLNDNSWQHDLSSQLAKNGINLNAEALRKELSGFFDMLEQKGCKGKEEADCRQYAFNWINYNHKNKNHGKESKYNGKAGSAEISANRPEDYNGVC
jgi:hypothetical protein